MPDEGDTRHDTELERSRRRLEAIFDSPDSFIGVLTPDGTLLEANGTALEFLYELTDRERALTPVTMSDEANDRIGDLPSPERTTGASPRRP